MSGKIGESKVHWSAVNQRRPCVFVLFLAGKQPENVREWAKMMKKKRFTNLLHFRNSL
jgi:hypothetical protein